MSNLPAQAEPLASLKACLQAAFSPSLLEVDDFSHQHAGHYAAASHGATHLKLHIRSAAFNGLSLIDQHRLVQRTLKPAFAQHLHALILKTEPETP